MDVAMVVPVAPAPPPAPASKGGPAEEFGAVFAAALRSDGAESDSEPAAEAAVDDETGDGEAKCGARPEGFGEKECCICPMVLPAVPVPTSQAKGDGSGTASAGSRVPDLGAQDVPASDPAPETEVTTGVGESLPDDAPAFAAPGPRRAVHTTDRGRMAAGTERPVRRGELAMARLPDGEPGVRGRSIASSVHDAQAWSGPSGRARSERLWGFWLRQGAGTDQHLSRVAGSEETAPETNGATLLGFAHVDGTDVPEGASVAAVETLPETPRMTERSGKEALEGLTTEDATATTRLVDEPAKESAARELTPAGPPARQVANAVHVAIRNGGDRVSVHLKPEHLGRVEVVLSREAGGVTAHLRVESAQAHQALTAEVPVLRQALEARGVSLVHVQVDLDDSSQGGQRPGGEAGGRRRRGFSGRGQNEFAQGEGVTPERWRPWGFEALI